MGSVSEEGGAVTPPGMQTRYAPLPALLTAALFLFVAPVYWRAVERPEDGVVNALENAELYQRAYPAFHYGFHRLRHGEIPLWNPSQFCGTPFLANPATGLLQPLNAVFLVLPTASAMAWHAALCLGLMGFGFALFARSLGVRYASAVFGGATYAFSGTAAAAMSRPELANALAWAPWLFWALTVFPNKPRLWPAALAGITTAFLLLCGSSAAAAAVLLLAVPYALLGVFAGSANDGPSVPRKLAGLAVSAAIALGIAAVQWVPTLEWLARLDAPLQTLTHVDLAGQSPARLSALLVQTLSAGREYLPRLGYFGIAALVVLPAVLFHPGTRLRTVFFGVAALLCAAAAASGNAALRACFLPLVFCVAAWAAIGVDILFQSGRDARSPFVWGPQVLVWVSLAIPCCIAAPAALGRAILLAVPLALLFLVRRFPAGVTLLVFLFTAVHGFDLAAANGNHFAHPFGVAACESVAKILTGGASPSGARSHIATRPTDTSLPLNAGLVTGAPLAGGAFWPLTREQARWWRNLCEIADTGPRSALGVAPDAPAPQLMNLMAVGAVVVPAESPFAEAPWPEGAVRLAAPEIIGEYARFANASALPRAYWVSACRVAPSFDAALSMILGPQFDASGACVVEGGIPEPAPAPAREQALIACAFEAVAPEHVIVNVDAPHAGVVVLSESFDPGWRATRNGEAAPVLRANGLFLGVAVPPGQQRIEFTYRPPAFLAGLTISLLTLGGLALAGLVTLVRAMRTR